MDKLWYSYKINCYSPIKKEWTTDIWNNLYEFQKHYTEWKKKTTEAYVLNDFTHVTFWKKKKMIQKSDQGRDFGVIELFYILNVVVTIPIILVTNIS